MERTARCACGALVVAVWGEPSGGVVACHCLDCQRRTGSAFGVGAYFPREHVVVSGLAKEFVRATESGNDFCTYFCPVCGTSTHWYSTRNPDLIGVAAGAFADPSFPPPVRSVWERSMHGWVEVSCAQQHFARGRGS